MLNIRCTTVVVFVKSYAWNTSSCLCCNVNEFVFPNFQGSTATQLRYSGNVICSLLKISCAFQQWKKFENILRFDKVTADYKAVPFLSDIKITQKHTRRCYIKPHLTTVFSIPTTWRRNAYGGNNDVVYVSIRVVANMYIYTLCLKIVPTFELSVTLSNLNRFSNFLHCWKAYKICNKTHTTSEYPHHLRYVTTLSWEIKSLFCRYSADMEENANKFWYFRCLKYGVVLHTDCK